MGFVATTISAHIIHENEQKMKKIWVKEGQKIGELNTLKKLYRQKVLTKAQYERRIKPLIKKMESL